jgi:hypothetical protein
LELTKCFYYIVVWVFNEEGEARLARKDELNVEIVLQQSKDGKEAEIEHKDCTEDHRTLGVMTGPQSTQKAEYKKLETKGSDLGRHVAASHMSRIHANLCYAYVYLGTMGYSLAVTHFTEKQLAKIQSKPIRALMSAMGFNPNMPKEVLFGPKALGGGDYRHLYVEQGTQQVLGILRRVRDPESHVGVMLMIAKQ